MTEADDTDYPQWAAGALIQAAREDAGYSKRQAARKSGISEGRWRQLEDGWEVTRGAKIPVRTTPETIVQIAHAMAIDAEQLLKAAGIDPGAAPVVDVVYAQRTIDVSDLTVDEIDKVRSYVDFVRRERGRQQ
ncbi:helix-turn-helix domain-containing protein [Nocardia asteroides]|uniref:helix-turn-helix domain-containing protein n=1 Tax=Nocardia asteroides TaxID=1824 RepID=UPI0033C4EB73